VLTLLSHALTSGMRRGLSTSSDRLPTDPFAV